MIRRGFGAIVSQAQGLGLAPSREVYLPLFQGTERYRVVRQLGQGGMGVVYEAHDLVRGVPVALKTMRGESTGEGIARLKAEFRSLADVQHPNLVALYELERAGDLWFFTMELLRGQAFSSLLEGASAAPPPTVPDDWAPTEQDVAVDHGALSSGLEPEKIGGFFAQIARGVAALHARGKLHRDLKPSNVMIEPSGRAVILDFGLVSEAGEAADGRIMGTPVFMAPEQALGHALTEACDWYAFGTMLYRAVCGALPFGTGKSAVAAKMLGAPPTAAALLAGELGRLADELIRFEPSERPRGAEVLARLEAYAHERASGSTTPGPRRSSAGPVGRTAEVAMLESSLRHAERGRLSFALVTGDSGIGKSELLSSFAQRCAERGAVVLTGRCFDRENIPYKMLDPLVDDLVTRLGTSLAEQRRELSRVSGADKAALARMFPAFAALEPELPPLNEPEVELRARGFAALVETLRVIRRARPVVLWIDDVQWGDADSLGFFAELLRSEDPPPLLCVLSGRSEDSPVHRWFDAWPPGTFAVEIDRISVGPLSTEAARELALSELPIGARDRLARAQLIAQESGGSPLWVRILASATEAKAPSLEGLVLERVLRLNLAERQLVVMAAIAVRPLSLAIAQHISGGPEALQTAAARPCADLLLRVEWTQATSWYEPFHDRVRQILLDRLSPAERVALHRALAELLEELSADPELLALHYQGAKDPERAARYAEIAAEAAARSLAFDRAATLYQIALDGPAPSDRVRLLGALANALTGAGKRREAGHVLLAASELATGEAQRSLRIQALRSFLLAGYVSESLAAVAPELERIGFAVPRSARASLLSAGLLALRSSLVRTVERDDAAVAPDDLAALELMWDVAAGLSIVDPMLGAKFDAFHGLLARRVGARTHLLRSLLTQAINVASVGESAAYADRRAKIEDLKGRVPSELSHAQVAYGLAVADTYRADWAAGHRGLLEARRRFSRMPEIQPEVGWSGALLVYVCHQLGRLREARRWLAQSVIDSDARGDLWSQIVVRTGFANALWLSSGEDRKAQAALEEAERLCSERQYTLVDGWTLYARCLLDLFRDDPLQALKTLEAAWPRLKRNFYLHVTALRISTLEARGRAAMSAFRRGLGARYGQLARADARRLEREGTPWSLGIAATLRAGLAPEADVPEQLRAAEAAFERADMLMHVQLLRRRRGALLGGDTGRSIVATTDQWAQDQGLIDLEGMSRVWVGF